MWLCVKEHPIGSGTHGSHMQTLRKGCWGIVSNALSPPSPALQTVSPKLFSISLPLLFLFLGCMCLHGVCVYMQICARCMWRAEI